MSNLRVKYIGPFAVQSGYAQAAHDYMLALHRAEVPLSIQPITDADSENLDPRYGDLLDLVGKDIGDPTHVVVHTIPRYACEFVKDDLDPGPGVKKICITTWETNSFPVEDTHRLTDFFDLIIVPSQFCYSTFFKAGVPVTKLKVIPHTFDPNFWYTPGPAPKADDPYTFYSILTWVDRKNPIGLLKAYWAEFHSSDNVLLRLVTPTVNEDDLATLARCMGIEDLAPVEILGPNRRLTEVELRAVHTRSHCYVTATRGEGFGLGAFEAALLGNPVIATEFGAIQEFLDHYSGQKLIDYHLTPAVTPEIKVGEPIQIAGVRLTPMATGAPTGIRGDQSWAEPDLHGLSNAMRWAHHERWMRDQEFAEDAKELFTNKYSYKTIGPLLREVLQGV